jgi:hypothetical protein
MPTARAVSCEALHGRCVTVRACEAEAPICRRQRSARGGAKKSARREKENMARALRRWTGKSVNAKTNGVS